MYPPKAVQDAAKPAVVAPPAPAPTPVTTFKMPTQVREAITLQGGNPDEFETRMQKAFSSKDPVVVKKAMSAYGQFLDANTDIRQPSYYSLLSPGSDLSFGDQLKLDAWDDFKNNAINALAQTKKGLRDTGSTLGHVLGLVPDLEKALNTNQEIQKLQTLALSSAGSKDMFDDFSINSFAATMGQGVGQVSASLAPMAIGAFAGPIGLRVGQSAGFVVSSAQMYGQLLDDFRAKGIPAETAAMYAGPLAAILGVIEVKLPLDKLVDKFASPLLSKAVLDPIITSVAAKGITKETMGELEKAVFSSQKQWLKGKASAVGSAVATQGGIEFVEEFSQGYIEDGGKKLYDWLNSDTRFKDIDFGSYQQFVDKLKDGAVGAMIGGHLASGVVLKSLHNQTLYPYLDKGIQNGDLDKRVQNLTNHAEFLVSKGKLDPAKRDLFLQDVQEVATLAQQVRGWAKPTADAQTRFDLFQLNRFRQEYLNHANELNGQNQQMTQNSVSLNPFEKGKNAAVIAGNDQMLRFLNDATAFIDTELSDLGAGTKTFDRNEFNIGLQTIYQNYNGKQTGETQTTTNADTNASDGRLSGGNQTANLQNPNQTESQTANYAPEPIQQNNPNSQDTGDGSQPQPRAEGQDVSTQPSTGTATPSVAGGESLGTASTNAPSSEVNSGGSSSGGLVTDTGVVTDVKEDKPLTPTEKALALAEEKVTKANRLKDAKKTVTAIEKDYPGFFEYAKSKFDSVKKTDQLIKKLAESPDEVNAVLEQFKQLQDAEDQRYRKAHNDYVDRAEQYNAFIEANKFKAKNGTYQSAESSQRKWLQANAPTFGLNVEFSTKGVNLTNGDGQKATRFGMPKDPATYIKPEDLTQEEYQNFDQYIRPYFADYYEKFVNKDTQQFQFSFSANGVVKNGSVAEGIRAAVEDIADGKSTKRADGLLMFVRLATNEGGLPIWVVKTAATQEKGMIPWDTLVQKEAEDFLTDAEMEPYTNFVLDFLSSEDWSDTDRDGIADALDEYLDMTEGYPVFDYQTYELDRDLGDETIFETLTPQAAQSLVTLFDQLSAWQKEVDEYNRRPDVFPPINTFQYATDQRRDQQTVPTAEQDPGQTDQSDVSPDNQPENGAGSADPNVSQEDNSLRPSQDSSLSREESTASAGESGQNKVSVYESTSQLDTFAAEPARTRGDENYTKVNGIESKNLPKEYQEALERINKKHPISKKTIPNNDSVNNLASSVSGEAYTLPGEIGIIIGFSPLGKNVYSGFKAGRRTNVDIESYTGKNFSREEISDLIELKSYLSEREMLFGLVKNPFIEQGRVAKSDSVPEGVRNYIAQMLGSLGISSNVFILTDKDANQNQFLKHGLYGERSAIRSSKTKEGSAEYLAHMRYIGNDTFYIHYKENLPSDKVFSIISHELGHIIERTAYEKASQETRLAIKKDYNKWYANLTGKTVRQVEFESRDFPVHDLIGQNGYLYNPKKDAYLSSFSEWFADNVAKWARNSERPSGIVEEFFQDVYQKLKKVYKSIFDGGIYSGSIFNWLDELYKKKYTTRSGQDSSLSGEEPTAPTGESGQNEVSTPYQDRPDKFFYFDRGTSTSFNKNEGSNIFNYDPDTGEVFLDKQGWSLAKSDPYLYLSKSFDFEYNVFDLNINQLSITPANIDKQGNITKRGFIKKSNAAYPVQAQIGEAQTGQSAKVIALANEIQSVFPNVELITDPAEIDRIQQENPNEFVPITSQAGQLLGFNFRGKVYVDPRTATPETAIHEFGHVWVDVAEQEFPAWLERGLSLIRGTEYEQRVREQYPWLVSTDVSKQYSWLTNDRALLKEALVQAIGEKGVALQNQTRLERFGKWLSRLFRDIGEAFGMQFNADTRLDDFVSQTAANLLSGEKQSDITSEQLAQSQSNPQALVANTPQTPLAGQRFTPAQIAQDRIDLKAALTDASAKISEANTRRKVLNKRINTLQGKEATYAQIINDPKTNVAQVKTYAKRLQKTADTITALQAELTTVKQLIQDQNSLKESAEKYLNSLDKLVTDSMVIYDADGNASYAVVDENSVSSEMQQVANRRETQQANAGILGKLHASIFSGSRLNPFVRTFEPHVIADYLFEKGSTMHNVLGETVKALSKKVGPLRVKGHDIMMDLTNQFRDICTYRGIASPDTMKSKGLIETITNIDGTTVEIPHDYLVTMVATYKTQMEEYGSSSMVEGQGTLLQDWKNPERRIKVKVDANEMLRLEQIVDNNYADLLSKTQDYFQFVLPSLQETYLNLEAKALPLANASFYFPIRYESELKEAVADGTTALVRDAPFVKERKGINDQDLIVTQSIFEMMNRYMRGTENYVQLMPSSQNFNLVKKHTTPFMERNGLMAYNRELEKMAIKFNNPMSDFEGGSKSIGVVAFKKVMGLTTLSRFALNVALPLKNLTGFSSALGQGIIDDKHIKDQFGFVVSAFGNGYYRLFSGIPKGLANLSDPSKVNNPQSQAIQDTIAEMYANPDAGPILSRVLNDGMPDLNTVEWATISAVSENNGVRTAIRRYNQAIGFIKEQGLTAQQQADSAVMLGFWRAATAHVQENMAAEPYDVQQKEIARLANDLLYATNATYDLTDKSSLQLDGRWWAKMIILYQSQGFKVFNTMVKSINDYVMDPNAANRKIMMANVRHTMIYAPIYIGMVNILASGLRALGDDDKEEKIFAPENAMWEIVGQLSQVLPVANVGTEFFVSAIDNRPWSSPIAQLDPFEPINKGAQGLLEAISLSVQDFETDGDQREADRKIKKGFQDAATELPTALGIPRELIRLVNKYAVTPALEE